jgi:hypothetical protein
VGEEVQLVPHAGRQLRSRRAEQVGLRHVHSIAFPNEKTRDLRNARFFKMKKPATGVAGFRTVQAQGLAAVGKGQAACGFRVV